MSGVTVRALQQLAALLLERAGLKINPDGYHSLRLALSARMPALGISDAEEYVRRLRELAGEHELRSLLPLVTVGHTEFFRDAKQFRALERRILPEALSRARRDGRRVSVWSAGCATGEEPYSVAMVLAELGATHLDVDLYATDLNPAAVENAQLGRYSARRMAGMSQERLQRFFQPVDDGNEGQHQVQAGLKQYVRFGGQNLAAPVFSHVKPDSLDVLLCRNVIIYFDLPTIRALMDRFLSVLRPGGILLLGYSESLFKVYDRFEMIEVEGSFVYRRPLEARPPPPAEFVAPPAPAPVRTPAMLPPRPSAVAMPSLAPRYPTPGRGSPPIGPLAAREAPAPPPRTPTAPTPAPRAAPPPARPAEPASPAASASALAAADKGRSPAARLETAVRHMERGDFPAALAGVKRLLADEPNDLDALLTLGNLQSLLGNLAHAREAFSQALQREPLCVEARVFGGVAALQGGELVEARSELAKALFLEPTLAIGHYLLAQVNERSRDFEGARRSYRNAIAQLRFPQRTLAGHYPEMPESSDAISRAARYALSALEEVQH
ncbi:tetratricopeptide repeat protein [Aggregicoccus sp. 17bor-14]|uniref:protein-glutamate O-methyltransferase n=1 Tax=Myxococcaceae TaxID=31 RepID=UPI00129CAD35|nr:MULTISPECIES: protein-glutamate O-methyltransferase [Myxococcaceae]MBF5044100.1 tetratricopeptide repeat protein [Simulacricoccus sp. 17bor-14]MRI89850.1 tetratricopeptide repeat protein [Aggregicoccus sp. 17bor-14]